MNCSRTGITPVFASSDAVFDGTRGLWTEEDRVNRSSRMRQKAAVENYLMERGAPYVCARLAKVVTSAPDEPGVLSEWIDSLEAGAVIRCARDQRFSPVDVEDVAQALTGLVRRDCAGVFHIGGPDAMTRLELLERSWRSVAISAGRSEHRGVQSARFEVPGAAPARTHRCRAKDRACPGQEVSDHERGVRDAARRRYTRSEAQHPHAAARREEAR